ncbi:hypothetical protein ANN_20755 [Periplaneta americana]|uniref:Uncharacterized protein n=1 Tax=Periplaneta americana TaxID=6978 RepID=A0ABQ8SE56_PERAM|nr:hypothetical protein ANN_20755 [Periplaneta americana]
MAGLSSSEKKMQSHRNPGPTHESRRLQTVGNCCRNKSVVVSYSETLRTQSLYKQAGPKKLLAVLGPASVDCNNDEEMIWSKEWGQSSGRTSSLNWKEWPGGSRQKKVDMDNIKMAVHRWTGRSEVNWLTQWAAVHSWSGSCLRS